MAESINRFSVEATAVNADKTSHEGNTGTTPITFTLTVNSAVHAGVSVDWATADGTATQPLDYTAANGTVTFAAGETTKTVTAQIVGETGEESYETFLVNLSNAVGVTIGDGSVPHLLSARGIWTAWAAV